jgi:hypothetical protein
VSIRVDFWKAARELTGPFGASHAKI